MDNNTWKLFLHKEKQKKYFIKIINKINTDIICGKIIYPSKQYIFHIFNILNFEKLKVVILGQDPYHGINQANGLAFSVMPYVKKIPPTLQNIYKAINFDIPNFYIPNHGYLIDWVKQGIMLLNTILTVEANNAQSHANIGWEIFTDNIINVISTYYNNIVFLLWGKKAQQKIYLINQKKHLVLQTSHPSPYSYHKGFAHCQHFSQTNTYLRKHYIKPINWIIKNI
ncbi:uracil-DNA glycosylase [Enterobacteriaceae endosymbiont of Neohaemonia nigricornis]|uniref:uracil-DNA glycosylase n=1 Tax=Enterobacteriaceae endosymbiont of Neohaemonia nigricornis TaxID=2675792 RepID=UPI0014498228|nr:uracil-DNA glycosylase [Enterobacteriaceae endosymbiont of Neohaemonia nigricornis]QJC30520.1 uracil-DNA glycosylase [Enterobacteriaceae endosymbiont of Neohaemonia nigricornis]